MNNNQSVTNAAKKAWLDSLTDVSFDAWLESKKLAGFYWGG